MKTATCLKVVVLVLLGVCSWVVTTKLLAQSPRQRAKYRAYTAAHQPPVLSYTRRQRTPDDPPPPQGRPPGDYYEMGAVTITPEHGYITVKGSASITDSRPDRPNFMWAVVIKDEAGDNILHSFPFRDQIFTVGAGKTKSPTFKDTFALGPGKYFVELRIYGVTPDTDHTTLVQTNYPHPGLMLSGGGYVTVN